MKTLKLFMLILLVVSGSACGLSDKRFNSAGAEEVDLNTRASRLLETADRLIESQRNAQPKSWNVSVEESMTKENPFTPPMFVLNSGVPPNLDNGEWWNGGLWNCRQLKLGSKLCQDDPWQHMTAQYITADSNSEISGQVGVHGTKDHTLVAFCKETGGVEIEIQSPYLDPRYTNGEKGNELEIGFDDEPSVKFELGSVKRYEFGSDVNYTGIITDTKRLLAKLMDDSTSVKIQTSSANGTSANNIQFLVKNFPSAWQVACGWHATYDDNTGIK